MIEADALTLHLNPLQEALQSGGDTDFAGLLPNASPRSAPRWTCRCFVKEVGWGISDATARRLVEAGVAGIDVAGAGGTCWSEVERLRADDEKRANVAEAFAGWGIPTAESIRTASGRLRRTSRSSPAAASGPASTWRRRWRWAPTSAGIAAPLLKAANESAERALSFIDEVVEGLRIAMFCAGIGRIDELKGTPNLKRRGME